MGCTSFNSISEINGYQQETIKLDMTNNIKGLSHANSLINLITRIRNKIIYLYHKLLYDTGACIYIEPTIAQCLKCIFYKVSSECEGKLKNAKIQHKEDPPYLILSKEVQLSDTSLNLFNELFNFITELISYKAIIRQIEKETPELLYLIYESKYKLSNKNVQLINKGIELFKNIKSLKFDILTDYKNQIYEFVLRNDKFCEEIDEVGRYANQNNITDIYEIVMIEKKIEKKTNQKDGIKKEMKMFKNVYNAKIYMENIINIEKNDDIIKSHESIIENLDESNINNGNNIK